MLAHFMLNILVCLSSIVFILGKFVSKFVYIMKKIRWYSIYSTFLQHYQNAKNISIKRILIRSHRNQWMINSSLLDTLLIIVYRSTSANSSHLTQHMVKPKPHHHIDDDIIDKDKYSRYIWFPQFKYFFFSVSYQIL